jgi:rhodanese-related sulfurtransferase
MSSRAGTSPAVPAAAVGKCPLLVLAARNKAPPPSAPDVSSNGDSCLAKAHALDAGGAEIFDLRERARFLEFHVPGARQATITELVIRPETGSRPMIVYDGGRFRSDALQLCDRLRHAGFRQVHVVDGGIAAWAQLHALPEALALNRLSDADVAAALAEPGSRPVVLDDSLRSALPSAKPAVNPAHTERVIVLATATTPQSAIRARLKKGITTLYWSGSPERLRQLLQTQLAQDRKRLAGPAVSKACSAL